MINQEHRLRKATAFELISTSTNFNVIIFIKNCFNKILLKFKLL